MSESSRQTVFISHANPADNEAAGWLAAKLSALGYRVWVDVEKFRGAVSIWRQVTRVPKAILARAICGGLTRGGL